MNPSDGDDSASLPGRRAWSDGDLLIPFGLQLASGEYVDIAEVERGAATGYVCPACKVPLIARKGEQNRAHFAHKTRGTYALIDDQCRFSIWTAMVLMGRQELGRARRFSTPAYRLRQPVATRLGSQVMEEEVTPGRELPIDRCEIETTRAGARWDAVFEFARASLAVVFSHPERRFSIEEVDTTAAPSMGVLRIDLVDLWSAVLAAMQSQTISRRDAFRRLLLDGVAGKHWDFHPFEDDARQRLQARIASLPTVRMESPVDRLPQHAPGSARRKAVRCYLCQHPWFDPPESDARCPKCGERGTWIPLD